MADDVDADATIVSICPACAFRARVLALPEMKGTTVTSIVVGDGGSERWTVMARRGENILAVSSGGTQEDAFFDTLQKLGVML